MMAFGVGGTFALFHRGKLDGAGWMYTRSFPRRRPTNLLCTYSTHITLANRNSAQSINDTYIEKLFHHACIAFILNLHGKYFSFAWTSLSAALPPPAAAAKNAEKSHLPPPLTHPLISCTSVVSCTFVNPLPVLSIFQCIICALPAIRNSRGREKFPVLRFIANAKIQGNTIRSWGGSLLALLVVIVVFHVELISRVPVCQKSASHFFVFFRAEEYSPQ